MTDATHTAPPLDGISTAYVRFAFRMEPHITGLIDAYDGPADLRAVPPATPAELVREADALLERIAIEDLPPSRVDYLTAQVAALATLARKLAGEEIAYVDEVRRLLDWFLGKFHEEVSVGPGPEGLATAMQTVADAFTRIFNGSADEAPRIDAARITHVWAGGHPERLAELEEMFGPGLYRQPLRIRTTLDSRAQRAAEDDLRQSHALVAMAGRVARLGGPARPAGPGCRRCATSPPSAC